MTSVTVKTVGNLKFKTEVNDETTVADLQKIITSDAPSDFLKGGIIKKLILKGKTLKETQTISQLGLGPNDEIVCLAKRVRAKKSKTNSPAKTEAEPAKEENESPISYTINPQDIGRLMQMGFPQHMVIVALRAAFADPKLACRYLIAGGIPADQAARLQKEEEYIRKKLEREGKIPPQGAEPQEQPEPQPAKGPTGLDARFESLLGNKDALTEVMGNAKVQQQCMQMLGHEHPDLFKKFMENPDKVGESDEFAKAMFNIMRKSFTAPADKKRVIRLTDEDRANLKKLQEECHCNRQQAAQVYINNGKSFERSKAFLDDLMRQAIQDSENAPAAAPTGPASPRAAAGANAPKLPTIKSTGSVRIVEPDLDEKEDDADDTLLTISPDMLFDEE